MTAGQPLTLDKLDMWRSECADVPSRAEAVRRLIATALASSSSKSPTLSDGEKLILTLLCGVYKKLDIDDDEINPNFIQSVILGGHYWGLKWEYPGLFHDHIDSDTTVTEVADILDMWSFIEFGYAKLSASEKTKLKTEADPFGDHVKFPGFCGNYESEYLNIARFLIRDMKRFESFKNHDLNSHIPLLPAYRRALKLFLPMRINLIGGIFLPLKLPR
ncbi:MAG: YfbU family protein [Alphaproteobacteria bacterium]|nr:YfbU family protein [Alphaproteobacteria bacterium]MCK5658362.1 YfbU family protein [Alphaproteobacteria bacterium]